MQHKMFLILMQFYSKRRYFMVRTLYVEESPKKREVPCLYILVLGQNCNFMTVSGGPERWGQIREDSQGLT